MAAKFPLKGTCPDKPPETMLCIEVRGLRMLANVPGAMSVQAIITDAGLPIGVAMRLCNRGSLADYIRSAPGVGGVRGLRERGCPVPLAVLNRACLPAAPSSPPRSRVSAQSSCLLLGGGSSVVPGCMRAGPR